MPIKNQIQIARGENLNIANSTERLKYGELLYNKGKNYISVGSADNIILKNAIPITVRNIKGYTSDLNEGVFQLGNTNSGLYELDADSTELFLRTPNKFNLYKGTDKSISLLNIIESGATSTLSTSKNTFTFGKPLKTPSIDSTGSITGTSLISLGNINGVNITGSTISTYNHIITPKISGVNNTLSIDATSSVNFNGNIIATDKTITTKTFIGEYETGDNTLSINK